jgi:hypothetical protein
MTCSVEMGSGAMIYIASFIKFRNSKVNRRGFIDTQIYRHTDSMEIVYVYFREAG